MIELKCSLHIPHRPAWSQRDYRARQSGGDRVGSVQELRQPLEALCVAHALDAAAHEQLDRPDPRSVGLGVPAIGHVAVEPQGVAQLVLRSGNRNVDLIAKDNERDLLKALLIQETTELLFRLLESGPM